MSKAVAPLGWRQHGTRHRGLTKGLVRCDLGLEKPSNKQRCRMKVGGQRFSWEEGERVFFDDTYHHEAWNETDEERAVLPFDFERPMTRRGRWLSRLSLKGSRRTAYFRDARRNQRAWEAQYRKVLEHPAA